jgi:arginine:ornithine antiporter/lysine permease
MVTLVSYGVMPQGELAGVSQPSMAAVLESIVGPWGSIFVRVGVIVSVLGAYLAWTLMAAEVLYIPAKTDDMPRFLARTNIHGARVSALIMAAGLISLLLVALLFAADALDFMLDLTAALSLIPYLLVAGKSYVPDVAIATVATVYTLFLVYAAGVDKLLVSCILYAPAAALYFKARRERGLRVFRPAEAVLFGVIVLGAVAGVVSLATGAIAI